MATTSYPKFPRDSWQTLRKRFAQTISVTVSEGFLANVLNIKESSAKVRIGSLKMMGLINDDGKPTDLANRWRHDDQYAEACEEIRKRAYPSEVLESFPAPDPDPTRVARWFSQHAEVGEDASKQLAAMYVLLCEADPTKLDNGNAQARTGKAAKSTANSTKSTKSRRSQGQTTSDGASAETAYANGATAQTATGPSQQTSSNGVSLHVDIQVHISPDMSLEQIDQVFKSIGTHLRAGGESR